MPVMFPPDEAADLQAVRLATEALRDALNLTAKYGFHFTVDVNYVEVLDLARSRRAINFSVDVQLHANMCLGKPDDF